MQRTDGADLSPLFSRRVRSFNFNLLLIISVRYPYGSGEERAHKRYRTDGWLLIYRKNNGDIEFRNLQGIEYIYAGYVLLHLENHSCVLY